MATPFDQDNKEPVWRRCDECDIPYFIGATMNPRNHKWRPIPLSLTPDASVPGNFRIDWSQSFVEVFQFDNKGLGFHPVVVYGTGVYRPHNPSHFLDEVHVREGTSTWVPTERQNNFKLAMEDNE